MDKIEITLEDLQRHCKNVRKRGNEYIAQCPYCQDSHEDNMTYNPRKGIIWCHANPQHSKDLLSIIYKEKRPMASNTCLKQKQWMINKEEYILYADDCHNKLYADSEQLNKLYQKRYVNPFTIQNTFVGYDFDKNKWVFPILRFSDDTIVGFRYRTGDLSVKKMWSETDTPSCISLVYGCKQSSHLYICEGEWDALIMVQILDELNQLDDSTVVTPSMGVGNLEKCIGEIDFSKFSKVSLVLDNDEASNKVTARLLEKYKFMLDKTPQFDDNELKQSYKDLTDWYYLNMFNKEG